MALHLALERARLGSVAPKHFVPHVEPPPRLQVSSDAQEPDEEKHGPHVMVIGSLASGKSTLIKTLANWAVKSGRTKVEGPGLLLVNLNPNDVCTSITFNRFLSSLPAKRIPKPSHSWFKFFI
jgi:polyribonucleotide 5'-hydroxyl-kinase